ncbi:MAG: hypothetical protein QXR58_02270 [Candidatus Micrarchaeaceae archaeon]
MDQKTKTEILYLAIYSLGFFTGITIFVLSDEIKNENASRIRFHCIQASAIGVIAVALAFVPYIRAISLIAYLYGIYIGYRAGKGNDIEVPYISEIAKIYK